MNDISQILIRPIVKSGGRTIRTNGYTKLKKRALVTLMEGYNIDLFSI